MLFFFSWTKLLFNIKLAGSFDLLKRQTLVSPWENSTSSSSPGCRFLRDEGVGAAEAGISFHVTTQSEGVRFMSWATALTRDDGTEADGEYHCWELGVVKKFCTVHIKHLAFNKGFSLLVYVNAIRSIKLF